MAETTKASCWSLSYETMGIQFDLRGLLGRTRFFFGGSGGFCRWVPKVSVKNANRQVRQSGPVS